MVQAIQNDLRHGSTAIHTFAGRFVIDCLRQAGERARTIVTVRLEDKSRCRRIGPINEWPFGVFLGGLLR